MDDFEHLNNSDDGFDDGFGDDSNDIDFGDDSNPSEDIDFGDEVNSSDDDDGFDMQFNSPTRTADTSDENIGMQSDEEKQNQIKKVALFAIGAGVVLIVIVCILARVIAGANNFKNNTGTEYASEAFGKAHGENSLGEISETQAPVAATQAPVVNNTTSSSNDWSEITYDSTWNFSNDIEGVFTVTNIKTYAKLLSGGEAQVKTEVTGSISGLGGTYTVELPVHLTGAVQIGQGLNVTYQMSQTSNRTVVGNIELK